MLLHRARWDSRTSPSTFCSAFSMDFHNRLIERTLALGSLQLLRLCAGDHIVGLLYNFVYAGKVYFYQSGIDYRTSQSNESPGLLLHARAIDFNAGLGHELYDFLAGDSQYKRSLAKHSNDLSWATVQAPRIRLRLESSLKRHYRRLRYRALEPR
jgi:CelD/BcsL family acetyltransferase involved in cellulose biosynthesis